MVKVKDPARRSANGNRKGDISNANGKRKDVGCPNTHLRLHLCLTPKEVANVLQALDSTARLRSKNKDREYLWKIMEKIIKEIGHV